MAYTFLQATNAVLKRVGEVAGDAGAITSFTDTTLQRAIDVALQIWNETLHELFIRGSFSQETATGTITIVTGTREYSLASDFEEFSGDSWDTRVLVNANDTFAIHEYPGGYQKMFADQPDPSDFTGQPRAWAINTSNGTLRLDTTPTSDQNGDVYSYLYDKRISLTATTDTFPVSDTVVDSLVPVVSELWHIDMAKTARDPVSANAGFKRALLLARKTKARTRYGVRRRSAGMLTSPDTF